MKLFKLGTLLTLLMLTGVLDYLISAIPVIASAWLQTPLWGGAPA